MVKLIILLHSTAVGNTASPLLSPLEHDSGRRVRQVLRLEQQTFRSFLLSFWELHVEVQKEISHDRLDLVCREEATWARVTSKTEGQASGVAGGVLSTGAGLSIWRTVTNVGEAKAIEASRIWVEIGVHEE